MCLLQFGNEYYQFGAELALRTLKPYRFEMDASKIQRHEVDYEQAVSGITSTCRAVATLFVDHDQMMLAALMTVFYLAPSFETFTQLKMKLCQVKELPAEPVAPAQVLSDYYKEIYCVVDSLRPGEFNPSLGWETLS